METFRYRLKPSRELTPNAVITYIENNHPELKDMCYFNDEIKLLQSNDPNKCTFYFDPFHFVLEVKIK